MRRYLFLGATAKEGVPQTLVLALFESPQSVEEALLAVWTVGRGCPTTDEVDDNNQGEYCISPAHAKISQGNNFQQAEKKLETDPVTLF